MKKTRSIWVAGNWKMNHRIAETEATLSQLSETLAKVALPPNLNLALFPPMLSIAKAVDSAKKVAGGKLRIGSQNTHFEAKGAFTGEVSAPMLQEIGVDITLVGHSERRQYFGETDASAKKRTEALLAAGFTVVHCIGETKDERKNGKTADVLRKQVEEGLPEKATLTDELSRRLVIAYEPVWAIGTGDTATPEQAEEAHVIVRKLLETRYGAEIASRMPILYGGSVTPENFGALLELPNVDGGLVGGASLKPDSYGKLVTEAVRVLGS